MGEIAPRGDVGIGIFAAGLVHEPAVSAKVSSGAGTLKRIPAWSAATRRRFLSHIGPENEAFSPRKTSRNPKR
jgi:hypothetical protein